jgi:CRP/FNR family cyclic AMP-dependent transcriptional regulator
VDEDGTILTLPRGGVLTPEASALFQVLAGRLRLAQVSADRQGITSSILLAAGDAFAYRRPWLPGSPSTRIEAMADSRLLALRERHIPTYLARHPAEAERLLLALARHSEAVSEAVCDRALLDARRRLLRALLRLCERHGAESGSGVRLDVTQRDLASLTGCCRETVSGILAELARSGVVRTERGGVVLDRDRALDALDASS